MRTPSPHRSHDDSTLREEILCAPATFEFAAPDTCDAAELLPVPAHVDGSAYGSSTDKNEPKMSCADANFSIWYKVVSPGNGTLTVNTDGSEFNAALALHSGTCESLTELACDDSRSSGSIAPLVQLPVIAGQEIFIQIGAEDGDKPTDVSLNVGFSL